MYSTLMFKTKCPKTDAQILELFFKSWIDNECNNEVEYNIKDNSIFCVDFMHAEDAIALKLKGLPAEFNKLLEIIN